MAVNNRMNRNIKIILGRITIFGSIFLIDIIITILMVSLDLLSSDDFYIISVFSIGLFTLLDSWYLYKNIGFIRQDVRKRYSIYFDPLITISVELFIGILIIIFSIMESIKLLYK